MFIYGRCHCSSAAVTPAKYECDTKNLTGTFVRSRSGASVDPPTRDASPTTVAFHLQSQQSLFKDDKDNFTAEKVDEFRPRYQRPPRLLRKDNVSHRDHKQAKKEFSTQREPKRTACWTICLRWFIWFILRWPSSMSEKGQKAPEGELVPLLLTWFNFNPSVHK